MSYLDIIFSAHYNPYLNVYFLAQPAGYFAQEFMIEDMKIMMNDLKDKSENLERDMETVTKNMSKFIKEKEKEKHAEVIFSRKTLTLTMTCTEKPGCNKIEEVPLNICI